MATWEDVAELVSELDGAVESTMYGESAIKVGGKGFVWIRPLRKKDLEELALAEQTEPVIGVYLGEVGEQLALVDEDSEVFFRTTHIDEYPIAFVWLDRISRDRLTELVADAYEARRTS